MISALAVRKSEIPSSFGVVGSSVSDISLSVRLVRSGEFEFDASI